MPVVIAQDPKGVASKLGTILRAACDVLVLGKSLGYGTPPMGFGIDCDQALLQLE